MDKEIHDSISMKSLTDAEKTCLENNESKNLYYYFCPYKDIKLMRKFVDEYNYQKNLVYWSEFEKFFSLDEIFNLTDEDIRYYIKIFGSSFCVKNLDMVIDKIKLMRKKYPNYDSEFEAIVYEALSLDEICNLSFEASMKIISCCNNFRIFKTEYRDMINAIKRIVIKDKIKNAVKKLVKVRKKNI